MPVSAIRTKVRQEFEKHRYVNQLSAVDVLLAQSHMEFQVSIDDEPRVLAKSRQIDRLVSVTGNAQLLETTITRHEILQAGGRA